MSVPCPDCAAALPAVSTSCPSCLLPLTGPVAVRLWQVDQSLRALTTERAELVRSLRSGQGGEEAAGEGRQRRALQPAVAAPAGQSVVGQPGERPQPASRLVSWSPQQLLLAAGVGLLLVAAVVFVGIAWTRIGVLGQCAVLVAATGSAVVASRQLALRGLQTSSEAVAVLALGLAAVGLQAAHELGLLGLDRIDADRYNLGAIIALAAAAGAAGRLVPTSLAYPVGSALVAGLAPFAVLEVTNAGLTGHAVTGAAAALVGAAGCVLAALARRAVLAAVLLVTGAWAAFAAAAGLVDAYFEPMADQGASAVGALLGTAAAMAVLARTPRLPSPVRRAARYGTAAVLVGSVVAVTHHGGAVALTVVSVIAAMAVAALTTGRFTGVTPVAAVGGYALAWLTGLAAELEPRPDLVAVQRFCWLAALALAAAVAARGARDVRRAVALAAAGVTAVLAASAAVQGQPVLLQVGTLIVLALTLSLAAGWRLGLADELPLAVSAVVGALAAGVFAAESLDMTVPLAVALGSAGLVTLGYATLPGRGLLSIAGVLLCSAATWAVSFDAAIDVVEVYTLPLAALALAVGAVRWHRDPAAPSWTTVGPGLSAALLPSALAATTDDALTRPLVVLAAAVAAALAGTALRWQAPVVTGATAALVVAGSQLAPYAVGLPRWLSLGVAGVVLLGLGARYEQRRADARRTGEWLVALR